jgi:Tfp pilus assembly protein PilF
MSNFLMDEKFFEADELIKENKIAKAQELLLEILSEEPTYAKAHNHLGWIYETKLRDYPKAESHYQLAIKYDPFYTASYYNYAALLSTQKRWSELEKLLNSALQIKEINQATIHNEFGIMYEVQGEFEKAILSYKTAALQSLDMKSIDLYKSSIERCRTKQTLNNL